MTRKTPEEIEAMAMKLFPDNQYGLHTTVSDNLNQGLRRRYWVNGYTANTELEDFKKELVEKVESQFEIVFQLIERITNEQMAADQLDDLVKKANLIQRHFIDLITKEDQTEVKKEEKV